MRDVPQLRYVREGLALSQRDLAARSGVAHDTIGQLERGERKARPSTIRKLAEALGVEPSVLLAESRVEAWEQMDRARAAQSLLESRGALYQAQESKSLAQLRMELEALEARESQSPVGKKIRRIREEIAARLVEHASGKGYMERYVAGHSGFGSDYLTTGPADAFQDLLAVAQVKLESDNRGEIEGAALLAWSAARHLIKSLDWMLRKELSQYEAIPDHYYEDPASARRIGAVGRQIANHSLKGLKLAQKLSEVYEEALYKLGDEASPGIGLVGRMELVELLMGRHDVTVQEEQLREVMSKGERES